MATCSFSLWVKEDYLCLLQVSVDALSFGSFSGLGNLRLVFLL